MLNKRNTPKEEKSFKKFNKIGIVKINDRAGMDEFSQKVEQNVNTMENMSRKKTTENQCRKSKIHIT